MSRPVLPCLSLILVATPGFAQLTWEKMELEFHPSIEATQVTGEFRFTNNGDRPITITNVRSVCDCTVTELEKKTYQPGESGKIIAKFAFGKRQGLQQKPIFVTTDEPNSKETALIMKTHIPVVAEVQPLAVWWKRGGESSPQIIHLKVLHESAVKVVGVKSDSDLLVSTIKTITEGREYEIVVTPKNTAGSLRAWLDIQTDFPQEARSVFPVYVLIP